MARPIPKYRRQHGGGRQVDRAFAAFNGERVYFPGEYDSDESRQAYAEFLVRIARGESARPPTPPPEVVRLEDIDPETATVHEVLGAFVEHAKVYYRNPLGEPTGELGNFLPVFELLREHYGKTLARDFDSRALEKIQTELVRRGLARETVNKYVARARHAFRWAAKKKLIPASVRADLTLVDGLKKGRSRARETRAVAPVRIEDVLAIRAHVSRVIWAVVKLQLITGARPKEILRLRRCEVHEDYPESGPNWVAELEHHKTAHLGKKRHIILNAAAQEVLRPYLQCDPESYLFSPEGSAHERILVRNLERRTPASCGNRRGTNNRGVRTFAEFFDTRTYCRAIARACERAGIPKWSPNQLRHLAATEIRRLFGLDAAQAILGHADSRTTERYASPDFEEANRVMVQYKPTGDT